MKTLPQQWIARMRNFWTFLGKAVAAFCLRSKDMSIRFVRWLKQQSHAIIRKLAPKGQGVRDRSVEVRPSGARENPSEAPMPMPEPPSVERTLSPPAPDPISPFSGRGVWIWRMVQAEDGQLQRIIEKAKLAGLDWVAIKAANGNSHWVQFNPEVIRKIQEVGIKVFGWLYAYGNNPQNEAEVAKGVLRLGCDGLIIDAEREYEGKHAAAERYLSLIRTAFPNAFIAYSSFPIISKHPAFPYAEFGKYCDASLPQCYWKLLGYTPETMIDRLQNEWGQWAEKMRAGGLERAIIPLLPVGQGFNVEAQEVERFIEATKDYTGVNLWEWSQMSKEVWQVFTK